MILTYTVTIDEGIPQNKKEFERFVQKTLNDRRGIPKLFRHKLKFKQVPVGEKANIELYLSTNEKVNNICGFDLLSCADMATNRIYINWTRWKDGSETFKSGVPAGKKRNWLKMYRQYIVVHEFMHILGCPHVGKSVRYKKGEYASPMVQQTIDLQGGLACPWPKMSDKKLFKNYIVLDLTR